MTTSTALANCATRIPSTRKERGLSLQLTWNERSDITNEIMDRCIAGTELVREVVGEIAERTGLSGRAVFSYVDRAWAQVVDNALYSSPKALNRARAKMIRRLELVAQNAVTKGSPGRQGIMYDYKAAIMAYQEIGKLLGLMEPESAPVGGGNTSIVFNIQTSVIPSTCLAGVEQAEVIPDDAPAGLLRAPLPQPRLRGVAAPVAPKPGVAAPDTLL